MNKETLQSIIQLIDIVAARGAIKGTELEAVGKLRAEITNEINKTERDTKE